MLTVDFDALTAIAESTEKNVRLIGECIEALEYSTAKLNSDEEKLAIIKDNMTNLDDEYVNLMRLSNSLNIAVFAYKRLSHGLSSVADSIGIQQKEKEKLTEISLDELNERLGGMSFASEESE